MEESLSKQYLAKLKELDENAKKEYTKRKQKEETKEDKKIYWKYIQGHQNPYGKEFYDYVKKHKNIKFSKNEKIARKEMQELIYKIHVKDPTETDGPSTLCEKSTSRMLIEFLLDLPDLL